MALFVELIRPDDLLHLRITGENLRLKSAGDEPPALVLDDAAQPAFLVVSFPPQTIVEEAVYESAPTPALDQEGS